MLLTDAKRRADKKKESESSKLKSENMYVANKVTKNSQNILY
jgi:hypothetical protein